VIIYLFYFYNENLSLITHLVSLIQSYAVIYIYLFTIKMFKIFLASV